MGKRLKKIALLGIIVVAVVLGPSHSSYASVKYSAQTAII